MSADELALLAERGWIRSTMEGMWENSDRVGGPVSLPEALEIEAESITSPTPADQNRPEKPLDATDPHGAKQTAVESIE